MVPFLGKLITKAHLRQSRQRRDSVVDFKFTMVKVITCRCMLNEDEGQTLVISNVGISQ